MTVFMNWFTLRSLEYILLIPDSWSLRRAEMGFQYVEYKLLENFITESIKAELKHHKITERNLRTGLRILQEKSPERAMQCKFLLAVKNNLNQSDHENKTCILNAAAFYIRNQIDESYQGVVTPVFLKPENSNLFNSLTTSLSLNRDNFPDSKNLQDMYGALSQFMHAHVYKNADPRNGYLDESCQIFSRKKIRGYEVEKVLVDLLQKINELKLEQVKRTKEEKLGKEPEKKSATQVFGLFAEKSDISMVVNSTELETQLVAKSTI